MTSIRGARLSLSVLCLTTIFAVLSFGQEQKKAAGSVAGRVMLSDKPVVGATVTLSVQNPIQQQPPAGRAVTDEGGKFKITGVPAGTYNLAPYMPAFVGTESTYGAPGKTLVMTEAEDVDGIDFSLRKGAVITGRVTDADGKPIIEQRITLELVDERGTKLPGPYRSLDFSTDDRGIYRAYGVEAGRYKVSVGSAPDSRTLRVGFAGRVYVQTFHPDVTDEASAMIVEVTAGGEASGIDIKIGRTLKSYAATGHVVDADTGSPLSNLQYGIGSLSPDQKQINATGFTNNRTNGNGEFRIEGLNPGRFAAFIVSTEQVDFYSEPTIFDINDSDVNGLEIRVRRGSSISGVAVIEGSTDTEILERMSKLQLYAWVTGEGLTVPIHSPTQIATDGSFRIIGLPSGKAHIGLGGYPPPKGFSVLRVERDGVQQLDGIDVGAGESVSGIRLVIAYGAGVIRGQVIVQGGELPANTLFMIFPRRTSGEPQMIQIRNNMTDARGRFVLDGLPPGEYEITARPMFRSPVSQRPGPIIRPAKQTVTVTNDSEAEVTLVIDVSPKPKSGEN